MELAAEGALSESLFKQVFSRADGAMALLDLQGRCLAVNRALADLVGWIGEEMAGSDQGLPLHAEDAAALGAAIDKMAKPGAPSLSLRKRLRHKNGHCIAVRLTLARIDAESARAAALLVQLRPVADSEAVLSSRPDRPPAFAAPARQPLQETLLDALSKMGEAIVVIERGRVVYYNEALSELIGVEPEAAVDLSFLELFWPAERPKVAAKYRRRLAGEVAPRRYESALLHRRGWRIDIDMAVARLGSEDDSAAVIAIRDISRQKQAQQQLELRTQELAGANRALAENEQRYRDLIEGSVQGIVVMRVQEGLMPLYLNDAAARLFAYGNARQALQEQSVRHLIPAATEKAVLKGWRRLGAGKIEHIHTRARYWRRDGSEFWAEIVGRAVIWDGEPALQLSMIDVTERQRMEAELKRLATTDPLTGLCNRYQFSALVGQEIRRTRRHPQALTLMMLDVDHFKRINDTFGHGGGDAALQGLAEALREVLRDSDIIGRMGGEEFAALLLEADLQAARDIAERLRQACEQCSMPYRGQQIRITVSIGLSQWRPHEKTAEEALLRADQALYRAKRGGRNRVEQAL